MSHFDDSFGPLDWSGIPDNIRRGLERYVDGHVPPGGGLRAILENDLRRSVARTDADTFAALARIVAFVTNAVPALAWGSPKAVASWCERRETCAPCKGL